MLIREQWRTVLDILIVCAATDESIKTKGLSWVVPQVLWLLALLTHNRRVFHHLPKSNLVLDIQIPNPRHPSPRSSKPSESTSKPSTPNSNSAMPVNEKIKFPDLRSKWPFPRTCSPHSEVAAESDEWIQSFKAFPTQEEMDAFKHCNFGMSIFPSQRRITPESMQLSYRPCFIPS